MAGSKALTFIISGFANYPMLASQQNPGFIGLLSHRIYQTDYLTKCSMK